MQVAMHPVVNVVDDSQSRIRTLEDQVARLRSELARKERAPAPPVATSEVSTGAAADVAGGGESAASMEARLQAQLRENEALLQGREALARCFLFYFDCVVGIHVTECSQQIHDRRSCSAGCLLPLNTAMHA